MDDRLGDLAAIERVGTAGGDRAKRAREPGVAEPLAGARPSIISWLMSVSRPWRSRPHCQKCAQIAPTGKPSSASSIAGARIADIGIVPWRAIMSNQPAHAPGTVTVSAWYGGQSASWLAASIAWMRSRVSRAGARPEPLSAVTARVRAS
jgi:hypothetical protein